MTASRTYVALRFARQTLLMMAAVGIAVTSLAQEEFVPSESCPDDAGGGCAVLEIGGATGIAGETVEIDVAVDVDDFWIAGLQLDMVLPDALSIEPLNCRVAPDLGKQLFAALTPSRGDRRLRAVVLSLANVDPLPGGTLFSCSVEIAADAAPGRHPIDCDYAIAADGATPGDRVPNESFVCTGGEIVVADPLPTPTAIPTSSSDERALVAGAASDGGCDVGAASRGASSAVLLLPAALLLWRRREAIKRGSRSACR